MSSTTSNGHDNGDFESDSSGFTRDQLLSELKRSKDDNEVLMRTLENMHRNMLDLTRTRAVLEAKNTELEAKNTQQLELIEQMHDLHVNNYHRAADVIERLVRERQQDAASPPQYREDPPPYSLRDDASGRTAGVSGRVRRSVPRANASGPAGVSGGVAAIPLNASTTSQARQV